MEHERNEGIRFNIRETFHSVTLSTTTTTTTTTTTNNNNNNNNHMRAQLEGTLL
jgi:hypothetical protein